ncbi:hypothetical protein JXM67_11635 [candidate division WOR-3 bacterium]|nr:hypothetical protein [candidate division WOR-3 bacterium]
MKRLILTMCTLVFLGCSYSFKRTSEEVCTKSGFDPNEEVVVKTPLVVIRDIWLAPEYGATNYLTIGIHYTGNGRIILYCEREDSDGQLRGWTHKYDVNGEGFYYTVLQGPADSLKGRFNVTVYDADASDLKVLGRSCSIDLGDTVYSRILAEIRDDPEFDLDYKFDLSSNIRTSTIDFTRYNRCNFIPYNSVYDTTSADVLLFPDTLLNFQWDTTLFKEDTNSTSLRRKKPSGWPLPFCYLCFQNQERNTE